MNGMVWLYFSLVYMYLAGGGSLLSFFPKVDTTCQPACQYKGGGALVSGVIKSLWFVPRFFYWIFIHELSILIPRYSTLKAPLIPVKSTVIIR
jgi:hypothetical protein